MPIIEAGFVAKDGSPDNDQLVIYGPTILVVVSHFNNQDAPSLKAKALIDSGACESCIDNRIANELQLPVVDVMNIAGVGGVKEHPVYLAHIYIPTLERYQYGKFAGADLIASGQPHGVLMGRTFLQGVIMIYDGIRSQVTVAGNKAV